MSIFYKFGVEAGDACNVECPGALDMSLADLKLAIVQQRNINNVTDYDLQIENSQSGICRPWLGGKNQHIALGFAEDLVPSFANRALISLTGWISCSCLRSMGTL